MTPNWTGLLCAAALFVSIGLGFVWVIKLEYYAGAKPAPWVAAAGLALVVASAWMPGFWPAALAGITGGTLVWGATELPEQEKRAAAGMFPRHPKRASQDPPCT